MKKYLQIALMILCISAVFTSCKDDDDNSDDIAVEAYKLENEKAFQAKANDPDYIQMKIAGAGDYFVYAKKLQEGKKPAIPIYYNSRVTVYYKGWYATGKDDEYFDKREFEDGNPALFAVSAASAVYNQISNPIAGWTIALQNMTVGEKWEVWIPQQLAYGTADYQAPGSSEIIPAYSTLVFEIEVVERTVEAAGTTI